MTEKEVVSLIMMKGYYCLCVDLFFVVLDRLFERFAKNSYSPVFLTQEKIK